MTARKQKPLPKGYTCTRCGKEHAYVAYVYAHWYDILTHTCEDCGAQHNVREGKAYYKSGGKVE